jgi:ABC-type Mn2+/Zn2+ transport system ATPase subunit
MATPQDPAEQPASAQPTPVAEVVAARLARATLAEPVRTLLQEALDVAERPPTSATGRIRLDSVHVAGYRGIGVRAHLKLTPGDGVNLVVGRNGSGKTSLAEGIETAFTGTNTRWQRADRNRREVWRNLHGAAAPSIEVKLAIGGDSGRSTLTRTWPGDTFEESISELRRPGHGRTSADDAPWARALSDYRPFLSYSDLGEVTSGRPTQLYDTVNIVLGLGYLSAVDSHLQAQESQLNGASKRVRDEVPGLLDALFELPDEDRALRAATALEAKVPNLAELEHLLSALPTADDDRQAELRLVAQLRGPDPGRVADAASRLAAAIGAVERVRTTDAEEARQRADLLAQALAHRARHSGAQACPVCGTDQVLTDEWAARAAEQEAALRREGAAAETARRDLRVAEQELRVLVQEPAQVPPALADMWQAWIACRAIADLGVLVEQAVPAARAVAEASAAASREAAAELAARDERWRPLYERLADWTGRARGVEAGRQQLAWLRKARAWLGGVTTNLKAQRMADFGDDAQRIWEHLRQESNVSLKKVHLKGAERASVRKLVMDVSIDGADASALSVMSQGEQYSLALALFLARANAADSPFGFLVIDDPVQSMDASKVDGLARVLHELGQRRQVVVFTHDSRLQRAFRSQGLGTTFLEVERGESSTVRIRAVSDPVQQALADARALASTQSLPPAARTHVLPGLCRAVLENAFTEAAWVRNYRSGGDEHALQAALTDADRFNKLAALALFGDIGRTADLARELAAVCGGWHAVDIVRQCQDGAHVGGASIPDPHRFVDQVADVAEKVRRRPVAGA